MEDVQTVSLVDNTPPTWLHVPADASLAMGDDLPWATWLAEVQAEDLCTDDQDLTVDFSWDTLASETTCTDTLEVTWTVTDGAGLSSSAVQLVALADVQAPSGGPIGHRMWKRPVTCRSQTACRWPATSTTSHGRKRWTP